MADSTVTVTGNLTRDPELRFSQKGQAILNVGIAVSRRYQVNGEWQEQTSFFNVVAYGQLAENVASSLSKGSRAIITGRLEQRSFETREGDKRTVVEIVADEIGPSLRWASAEVTRNERTGQPTHAGAQRRPAQGGASQRRKDPDDSYDAFGPSTGASSHGADDEPF